MKSLNSVYEQQQHSYWIPRIVCLTTPSLTGRFSFFFLLSKNVNFMLCIRCDKFNFVFFPNTLTHIYVLTAFDIGPFDANFISILVAICLNVLLVVLCCIIWQYKTLYLPCMSAKKFFFFWFCTLLHCS